MLQKSFYAAETSQKSLYLLVVNYLPIFLFSFDIFKEALNLLLVLITLLGVGWFVGLFVFYYSVRVNKDNQCVFRQTFSE